MGFAGANDLLSIVFENTTVSATDVFSNIEAAVDRLHTNGARKWAFILMFVRSDGHHMEDRHIHLHLLQKHNSVIHDYLYWMNDAYEGPTSHAKTERWATSGADITAIHLWRVWLSLCLPIRVRRRVQAWCCFRAIGPISYLITQLYVVP